MHTTRPGAGSAGESADDAAIRLRLAALFDEGWALCDQFAREAEQRPFHPFVASDYDVVAAALWPRRRQGLRFLEWGSANGVLTVMADLLGFEACGIELDESLVHTAHALARRFDSRARFVAGSFLPTGYRWRPRDGDARTGTLGVGRSGYLELGRALDEFDVVLGFPWDGEAPMMHDVMRRYGRADAVLLLHSASEGIRAWRGGRELDAATW